MAGLGGVPVPSEAVEAALAALTTVNDGDATFAAEKLRLIEEITQVQADLLLSWGPLQMWVRLQLVLPSSISSTRPALYPTITRAFRR